MAFNKAAMTLSESVPNGQTGTGRASVTRFWKYVTPDALATVVAAGYFNDYRLQLAAGDVIEVVGALTGTPVYDSYVVTASPATGNVTTVVEAV